MSTTIIILLCHFLTAFTVLGMPLFMPRILDSFSVENLNYLIGIIFIVPISCAALSAPIWGRFSDRYGKKKSLLRAQLGLTLGFLISGFSESLTFFMIGLVIQGVSGGTLAASNAYFSCFYKGKALANKLNLTQLSTRFALIIAPLILGLFSKNEHPLLIYRYLALLPFTALLICLCLPKDKISIKAPFKHSNNIKNTQSFSNLLYLQFLFCFSMVITFPYFLPYVEHLGENRDLIVGFYYSFPNFVYLFLIFYLTKLTLPAKLQSIFGFILLGCGCLGQFLILTSDTLILYRLLFGLGILLTYNGLHQLLSQHIRYQSAGFYFGKFDSIGKWAGVFAGIFASFTTQYLSVDYPFLFGAISCAIAVILLTTNSDGQLSR